MTSIFNASAVGMQQSNAAQQLVYNGQANAAILRKPQTVRDSIDARINYLQGELERLGHLRRKLESVLDMPVADITGAL